MESNGVTLIYDSLAQQQADYLLPLIPRDFLNVSNGRLWNRRPLPVILHSSSAYSNGLVSWAPRRMETYGYADNESDCTPWLLHLATHEGRHAWQTTLIENGQTTVLNAIFGQQATGLVLGLFVPKWLLEGDAVWSETTSTNGGRGRDASWIDRDRAIALAGEMPTYEQSFFGSYRHFFPDFYHMGYLLSAYGRLKYNTDSLDIWHEILKECGRTPLSLNPFDRKLRHLTGMRRNAFYREAMNYWHNEWKNTNTEPTPEIVTGEPKYYTSYSHPHQYLNSDTIVAYRISTNDILAFVALSPDGKETVLHYPGLRNEEQFDLHGDTLVWSERQPHPRWTNASQGVIKWLSLSDRRVHTISHLNNNHLSAPSVSIDGSKIVMVEQLTNGQRAITVTDFKGNTLYSTAFPIPYEPRYPIFISDDELAYTLLSENGISIVVHNVSSDVAISTPPQYANIRDLAFDGRDNILYSSDESGANRIYAINKKLRATYRLPISTPNAYHPQKLSSNEADSLLFSVYRRNGFAPVASSLVLSHSETDSITPLPLSVHNLPMVDNDNCPSPSRYHRVSFRPHSWGPVNIDPSATTLSPGLSMMSQNVLGTLTAQAGVNLDPNSTERFYAGISTSALFPIFSLAYSNQKEDVLLLYQSAPIIKESPADTIVWQCSANDSRVSNRVTLGFNIPLQFTSGPWSRSLSVGSNIEYRHDSGINLNCTEYRVRNRYGKPISHKVLSNYSSVRASNISYNFSAALMHSYAERQVGSRYGLAVSASHKHTPWGKTDYGHLTAASFSLYLPGIGHTHQIRGSISYQRRKPAADLTKTYLSEDFSFADLKLFANVIPSPRGCHRIESSRYTLLRTTYSLPVVDPDLSLGPILHIKRIIARPFYDYAWITTITDRKHLTQYSYGLELTAESYWLQLPYPVTVGARLSHRSETNDLAAEAILSIKFK